MNAGPGYWGSHNQNKSIFSAFCENGRYQSYDLTNSYKKSATDRLLLLFIHKHSTAVACLKPKVSLKVALTPMTSRRSQLQEDTYFRVLRMLQENPDMTQREIAERLGVSTSGMNYCLNALIDKGWVKVHNFSQSKNKFGYIYVLTPQGIVEKVTLAGRFLKRKQAEYEALRAEIDSLNVETLNADETSGLAGKR